MALRLAVSGIGKSYNGNDVLKDCSFAFKEHSVYILTGPNGCGKSTFLRICALIEQPDKGEISYFSDGNLLSADLWLRRRLTLVLPKVGVFNTSVSKNVAYGLAIRGVRGRESEERVDKALEFVRLGHKKRQSALTLSSGETKRLGIARALVIEPEFLFLDEPTASIDQKNTGIIENLILQMKKDNRTTVVMATHDREQAERLADSIIAMKDGKFS